MASSRATSPAALLRCRAGRTVLSWTVLINSAINKSFAAASFSARFCIAFASSTYYAGRDICLVFKTVAVTFFKTDIEWWCRCVVGFSGTIVVDTIPTEYGKPCSLGQHRADPCCDRLDFSGIQEEVPPRIDVLSGRNHPGRCYPTIHSFPHQ